MKKCFLILLIEVISCKMVHAQENLQVKLSADISTKYWYMRHRLINHFLKVGIHSGECIPAQERHESKDRKIKWGDGTVALGAYIGVLATEYKLLKMRQANTKETVKELYYALEAINRLDYMAEYYWSGKVPGTQNLNGFFIRNDVPVDFIGLENGPRYDTTFVDPYTGDIVNNYYHFNSDIAVPSTYGIDEFILPKLNIVETEIKDCPNEVHAFAEESQDQAIGLLTGLALVARLVDTDIEYIEETSQQTLRFKDQETFINTEAKDITKRILNYMKEHKWLIPNPVFSENGTYTLVEANTCDRIQLANYDITDISNGNVGGGNLRMFSFGLAEAGGMINSFMPGYQSSATANSEIQYFRTNPSATTLFQDQLSKHFFFLWDIYFNQGVGYGINTQNQNVAMNRDLALNLAAIGNSIYMMIPLLPPYYMFINNTGSYLRMWAHQYDLEYIAYINDILHALGDGTGNFDYPQDLDEEILNFLHTAPCYGPWKLNCEWDCNQENIPSEFLYGSQIWQGQEIRNYYASKLSSHNGFYRKRANGYDPDNSETWTRGEFNGLDFMLIHNLYLLTHSNFIPSNFSNMMDAVVDYTIPFYYSNGLFNLNLGSIQHNTPWKCYGFNSLDVHNAILTSDANVEFRTKNDVILGDNIDIPEGASVVFTAGYDAYDCDPFGPIFELRKENSDSENNQNISNNPSNQNSDHSHNYSIHPNPNNGKVTLTQSLQGYIKKIQLSTIMGQNLFEKEMDENFIYYNIDFNEFQKGIYILQLETTDGIKSERIIFQ